MEFLKPKITINQNKYIVLDQIGEGAYAFVYKVKRSSIRFPGANKSSTDERYFAIKKIVCQLDEQIIEAKKEINFLRSVKHPNIMKLIDSDIIHVHKKSPLSDVDEVYMLLPLYQNNVQSLVDKGKGFPSSIFGVESMVMRNILTDCYHGLSAIHEAGYRHADFKPANILLTKENRAVITDFGSISPVKTIIANRSQALRMQEDAAMATTASYRPPELYDTPSNCIIDEKTDVWSYGCTLYYMMFSKNPFESEREGLSTLAIRSGQHIIPSTSKWPKEYHDIIRGCLTVNMDKRFSMEMLWSHIDGLSKLSSHHHSIEHDKNIDDDHIIHHDDDVHDDELYDEHDNDAHDNAVGDDAHHGDDEDEFGDFESAPAVTTIDANTSTRRSSYRSSSSSTMPSSSSSSSTMPSSSSSLSSPQPQAIKTVFATMLRPRGLTRQLVSKPVCVIIIPHDSIIIRKSIDPDSKIHAIMSLKHPIRVNREDMDTSSSGLGSYQVQLIGSIYANTSSSAASSPVATSSPTQHSIKASLSTAAAVVDGMVCLGFESDEVLGSILPLLQ